MVYLYDLLCTYWHEKFSGFENFLEMQVGVVLKLKLTGVIQSKLSCSGISNINIPHIPQFC